jgi:O-acetyl-ADP-ribose deacetylase (regulator of RNase III)
MNIIKGNIFTSNNQTLVNTVNCVGVMGAGIALEYKLRYPEMFTQYAKLCEENKIEIGKLWLYKASETQWILNFPTKTDWKFPSKEEYLHKGLQKFIDTYENKGIESISFPLLGASHGGISEDNSISIMESYFKKCTIPIDVYLYDPSAKDDLYDQFKDIFLSKSNDFLSNEIGLRKDLITKMRVALQNTHIKTISQLSLEKGIGLTSIEKSFFYLINPSRDGSLKEQTELFSDE